eukprot:g2465.t1
MGAAASQANAAPLMVPAGELDRRIAASVRGSPGTERSESDRVQLAGILRGVVGPQQGTATEQKRRDDVGDSGSDAASGDRASRNLSELFTGVLQSATSIDLGALHESELLPTPCMRHLESSIKRQCRKTAITTSSTLNSFSLQEQILNHICKAIVNGTMPDKLVELSPRSLKRTLPATSRDQQSLRRSLPPNLRPAVRSVLQAGTLLTKGQHSDSTISDVANELNKLPPLSLHHVTVSSEASNLDHVSRCLIAFYSSALSSDGEMAAGSTTASGATPDNKNMAAAAKQSTGNSDLAMTRTKTSALIAATRLGVARGSQASLLGAIAGLMEAQRFADHSSVDLKTKVAAVASIQALEDVLAQRIMASLHSSKGGAPVVFGPPERTLNIFEGDWMHGLAMHPQASPCDFDVLRISYKLAASPSSDKWSLEVYDKKDIKTYRLVRSRPFVATTTPLNEVVTVVLPKALRVYRGEFLALRCLRGKTSDSESPPPVQLRISSWYEARNAWLSKDTPSSILYENHSEIDGTPESEAAGISNRPAGDPPSAFGCTAISHSRACSGIEDAAGNGEAKDCNAKVGRKLKACPGWSVEGRSIPSSALLHKKWRVVNSSGVHVYSVPSEESGQDPLYCKYFGDIVTEYDRQGEWIQINPKLQDAFESTHTDQWMHIHPGSGGRGLARQDNVPLTDISVGYLVPRKGDRVMRGPSWAYVDQDADKVTGMPGQGVVTRVWNAEDIAQVLWDNVEVQKVIMLVAQQMLYWVSYNNWTPSHSHGMLQESMLTMWVVSK